MQGILIDPTARTVEALTLMDWSQIGTAIGCQTVNRISFIRPNNDCHPDGVDIWVDDVGLSDCTAETRFWGMQSMPWPLAGRGLILGLTPAGKTVGTWAHPGVLGELVRWIGGPADLEAAIEAGTFQRPEASITTVGADGRQTRKVFWTWRWPHQEGWPF